VLTTAPAEETAERIARLGISDRDFWVGAASPQDVPDHLVRATAGIFFLKGSFSQIGVSPTKIPEYLAAGIPVVATAGVGDSDQLLTTGRVGVVVRALEPGAYREAAESLNTLLDDPALSLRCMAAARAQFDLESIGGPRYRRVYERLHNAAPRSPSHGELLPLVGQPSPRSGAGRSSRDACDGG
jgi:glycosyltransferase involved in cell wall biosynthesis